MILHGYSAQKLSHKQVRKKLLTIGMLKFGIKRQVYTHLIQTQLTLTSLIQKSTLKALYSRLSTILLMLYLLTLLMAMVNERITMDKQQA